MDLQYQLKAGHYHLYDLSTPPSKVTGEHRLRLKTDAVAIAFDRSTGALHEHGSPLRIHSWATNTRRRLRAAGAWDSAEDSVQTEPWPHRALLHQEPPCYQLIEKAGSDPS